MAKKPRWKRMNLNVEINLHDAFKAATAAQGKKMTDVLLEFIQQYVQQHPPQALKKGPRQGD
jgi:ParG